MSINDLWSEIERLLTPRVAAALRPPASRSALHSLSEAGGGLPDQLVEMYSVHEGTDQAGGSRGFCFIGSWYPLPVEAAIEQYRRAKGLTDLFGRAPLIPFAVGTDGSLLAVPPGDAAPIEIIFTDGPGGEYLPSIEELMHRTITGLQGEDSEFRPELTPDHLLWFNRKYEAGNSV